MSMYDDCAAAIGNPKVVYCRHCGMTQEVDAAWCLQHGWPKHCEATMTIDPPEPPLPEEQP